MSINLTDEIEVKTKKGKLCAAKQIFLEGDIQTVEKEIQDINSRHNILNTKHESLSRTVQGIAATGGASTATNVTYNNDSSGLNAENAQDAIDELSSIGHFAKRGGIVNISTNYNSNHIAEILTLSQALSKVPSTDRVLGFQGKYLATDGWHTIIYTGDSLTSWSDRTKWIDLADKIFNSISNNATFAGIATPATNPGTPDGPVFYFAAEPGVYSNFSGITVKDTDEVAILVWNDGAWTNKITGLVNKTAIATLNSKWVEYYFALKNIKLTDTTITFENYSFIYIKNLKTDTFVRYILQEGTYDIPTTNNKALYVSLTIKSENNRLIPTISESETLNLSSDCYILGIVNSDGKFQLSDATLVYAANKTAIEANKTAIEANKIAIKDNKTAIEANKTAIEANKIAIKANKTVIEFITSDIETTIPVSDEILLANKHSRLLDDGSLMTAMEDYICVSDFINIENRLIKNIKATFNISEIEGRNVAFAFYSDKTEDSFIESSRIYNSTIIGDWKLYDGDIVIPKGAKYIRISGNTVLYSNSPSIELYTIDINRDNIYANAPAYGYEYFTYDVDTSKDDIEDAEQSSNILFPSVISKDNGFIRIPDSYTPTGKPTRLVIYNHGAGGRVTENDAESVNGETALLLQKKGYAVLFINGVPEAMRNTNYMSASKNGAAAHMGGWVYIRSALAAYRYVTNKYNIAKDGCFIIGGSMGGVTTLNLAMSGAIPVKAIALNAPVIDPFHDAYFSGNWSGGDLNGGTPAIFAWIFQWDYCDFETNTYRIPAGSYNIYGQSYTVETEENKPIAALRNSSKDMAILWSLNENKMYGYNGYKTGDFLYKNLDASHVYNLSTDNDDDYFGKKLPVPCKIWFGGGDNVNQISIAKRFINKCRKGGSIAMLRTCPTSNHGVWGIKTDYDGNDISVEIYGEKYSPYNIELLNWLERWNGNA